MKRKILALVLGILLVVSVIGLVACNNNKVLAIDEAADYVFTSYKNSNSDTKTAIAKDYKLIPQTPVGDEVFTITWAIKETGLKNVSIEVVEGTPYIKIADTMSEVREDFTLVATIKGADGETRTLEFEYYYPAFKPVGWTEFVSACDNESSEAVTVKVYILGIIGTGSSTGSFYAQDAEGYGYYVYNPGWTSEEKENLSELYPIGTEVYVTGTGTIYNGQYEFAKGASVIKTGGENQAEQIIHNGSTDWSAANSNTDEKLKKYQNTLVKLDECVLTSKDGSYYYFVCGNTQFNIYDNTYFLTSDQGTAWKNEFEAGKACTITGLVSYYNAYQIYPIFVEGTISDKHTPNLTNAAAMELAMTITSIDETIYVDGKTVTLPTTTPFDAITIEWSFEDADKAEGLAAMKGNKVTYTVDMTSTTPKTVALQANFKCEGEEDVIRVYDVALVPPQTVASIKEFIALAPSDDVVYALTGWVVADAATGTSTGSFVIADETGSLFSYEKFNVEVGDYVRVFGTKLNRDGTKDVKNGEGVPQIGTLAYEKLEAPEGAKSPYEAQKAAAEELKVEDIDLSKLDKTSIVDLTGKLLKITGATFRVSSGYSQGAILVVDEKGDPVLSNKGEKQYSQVLSLYLRSDVKTDDWKNLEVVIYGYVRGWSTGSYLTIQVAELEAAPLPEVSDAEAVAYAKDKLEFVSAVDKNSEIELATNGIGYTDVEITWAVKEETDIAVVADGKLTITLGAEETTITVVATLSRGEATDTKEFEVKVASATIDWKDAAWAIEECGKLDGSAKEISEGSYFFYGVVTDGPDANYCNFYFKAGEKSIKIYGLKNSEGKAFGAKKEIHEIPIKEGDTVYLYGQLQNYNGTLEIINAVLQEAPEAGSCAAAPMAPAQAIEECGKLDGSTKEISEGSYFFCGVVADGPDANYCNFYFKAGEKSIKIYGLKNSEGKAFGAKKEIHEIPIKEGDTVYLYGQLQNYNGTLEIINAVLVSYYTPVSEETPEEPEEILAPTTASITFDFITVATKKGSELDNAGALTMFNAAAGEGVNTGLKSISVTKIYDGNGTGGAFENKAGFLKTGTGSVDGQIVLNFIDSVKVAKVEIKCYGWKNADGDKISVNSSAQQSAPINSDTEAQVLTFVLETASNVVTIDFARRVFIFEIVVTFAD